MRLAGVIFAIAGAASCGGASYELVEPGSAEVRLVVAFAGNEAAVEALAGTAPYRRTLGDERTEIWVLGYSSAQLAGTFPSLTGKRAEEIAAALSPRFDAAGGLALPQASEVHSAVVSKSSAPPYEARDWAAWTAKSAGRLTLHIEGEVGPADPCANIDAAEITLPMGMVAANVAVLSDELALVGGPWVAGDDALPMQLARVDGTRATMVTAGMGGPQGRPSSLIQDGNGFAYTVATYAEPGKPRLHRLDAMGRLLRAPPLELAGDAEVQLGTDGTLVARAGRSFFRFTRGSTAAVAWAPPNRDVRAFGYANGSRAAFTDGPSIYYWNGGSWRREYELVGTALVGAFAGDTSVMIAAGPYELVLRRNDQTALWEELPKPFNGGYHARGAVPLGGGRFAIAFNRSAVGIWTGTGWCRAPITPNTGFIAIAASPTGKTLFATGVDELNTPGSRPALIRVRLP